jgi:porin
MSAYAYDNPTSQAPAAELAETHDGSGCARYDALKTRTQTIEVQPPICDSVAPELGGARRWLADHGVGFQALTTGIFEYDILGHDAAPQRYGGQAPTTATTTQAFLTYDLSRLRVPGDAQLTIGGYWYTSSFFKQERYTGFATLAVNQRFWNGVIELQYGYFPLLHDFYGVILGGNSAAAAFGPASSVLVSSGVSQISPTPAAQLVLRDPESQHFYDTFIVSRSTSPAGLVTEEHYNPQGLRFSVPGTGAIFVDEIGYKRPALPEANSLWVRGGVVVNNSNYKLLDKTVPKATEHNSAVYGAVTAQLISPYSDKRGLYVDAKVDYSPKNVNVFAHDYSFTLFDLGPFAARSKDMVSLSWSESYFSADARKSETAIGVRSASTTSSLALSYAYHLVRGIYITTSLSKTWNPSFAPVLPAAIFFKEQLTLTF